MLKEFIKIAPEMKIKVNASNIAALEKWMKICTPAYVETDILNITPQFKEFCKSNHIKIMAGSSFGDEAGERKGVTGIGEETSVSVSALGISGARVYYVTVISCTYH